MLPPNGMPPHFHKKTGDSNCSTPPSRHYTDGRLKMQPGSDNHEYMTNAYTHTPTTSHLAKRYKTTLLQ